MTDTEREQFVTEIKELKLKIEELEGELEEGLLEINSNAIGALLDLVKDRHERLCGYGQPLHSCPDPLCRDACVALGVSANGDRP